MKKKILLAVIILIVIYTGFAVFRYIGEQKSIHNNQEMLKGLGLELVERRYDTHFGFLGILNDTNIISDLGIVWDRPHPGPFIWNDVGYKKYDWDSVDKYVEEAQNNDIVTLATIWPFHEEDQEMCHKGEKSVGEEVFHELPKTLYAPCDMDAYQSFITAMVERYDGDGVDDYDKLQYPIKYWEISNEPEMDGRHGLLFYQGTPQEYAEMLKSGYEAVKKADSSAKVLHAGAAGMNAEGSEEFWSEVFAVQGIGEYFDIANIHSLSGSLDLFVSDWKEFLKKNGIEDKSIWVTEAQYRDEIIAPPPEPVGNDVSPLSPQKEKTTQAELVKDGVLLAFANGADKIFWTTYKAPRMIKDDKMAEEFTETAFIESNGTKKESYYILEEYVEYLNHFTYLEGVEKDGEAYLRFTLPLDEVVEYKKSE